MQVTRESLLPRFGAVGGRRVPGRQGLYRIDTVIEKPTPTEAEQRLAAPGLRAGHYLCFFGMHVLTPAVMDLLGRRRRPDGICSRRRWPNWPAASSIWRWKKPDRRYDIGARYGLLIAQLALALERPRPRPRCSRNCSNCWPTREMAGGGGGSERADRRHHRRRPGRARPLARRASAAPPRSKNCWPSARRSTASAAPATTSTSACGRCSSSTPSTASTSRRAAARAAGALIPFAGYAHLLKRRFEEAIDIFLAAQAADGPSAAISSALAAGYRALGFQTLADQVRRSVRSVRGNQWMFRTGHPADYPLRIRPELLARRAREAAVPDPARSHAGAHGPDAQRLERHLLPRHGFSRKARGCSTSPSIWACAARRGRRPSRRWKPTSA